MSILDDAIREHLELKRAHGADEAELSRLEKEAFGPAERPGQGGDAVDPFAEAPTEFLTAPGAEETGGGRPVPNVADLQEPPPPRPPADESAADAPAPADELPAAAAEPSGAGEPAPAAESLSATDVPDPAAESSAAVEEQPAAEHRVIAEPASAEGPASPDAGLVPDPEAPAPRDEAPSATGGEQPTELFDVEQQLFEDTAQSASAADERAVDAERGDEPADEFDEFFSEQRLSDELNQALEAPLPDEPGASESSEHELPENTVEHELPEDSAEHDLPEDSAELALAEDAEDGGEEGKEDAEGEYQPEPGHADALEDTPDFLEDQPEGEDAWFEQRPPKDFDFGD